MKAEIYWVDGPWTGQLGIVPRPRPGEWLEEEIGAWRNADLNVIVSLLTPDEIIELGLQEEARYCGEQGIEFLSFPIPDYSAPESLQDLKNFVSTLIGALESGKKVAVHCRQSVGRSSLVVASVLVSAGEGVDEAFRHIATIRGEDVPETTEQANFVKRFAAAIRSRPPAASTGTG